MKNAQEQSEQRCGWSWAGLLVLIPLISALFYGVVGKDKYGLLAPLTLAGYVLLLGWLVVSSVKRQRVLCAPPAFWGFLVFIGYGVGLSIICLIPFEARIRMLFMGLTTAAYLCWANSFVLFRRSRLVLGVLIVFALITSMYGLFNFFKEPLRVLWTERYYVYEGRLASTYICPNHFAHLLQMLMPFCLVLVFIPQTGLFLRIVAGYSFFAFLPALYYTESRAGMLGSMAAVGVTVLLLALRKSKKWFAVLLVTVPLLCGVMLVGGWKHSEMFKRRMTPVVEFLGDFKTHGFENLQTRDFRPLTWLDSWGMVQSKPLTGYGPASYRYLFPEFRERFKGARILTGHPHNEYLEIAAEYGWIGFGIFALAWCYGLIRLLIFALKTDQQHHAFIAIAFLGTAAGSMLHSFFDFQLHEFQNALIFALLAAIAFGPLCRRRQEALLQTGRLGWNRTLRISLAALALLGLVVAVPTYTSAFLRATADRMVKAGKDQQSIEYYELALKLDASNWVAYRELGDIYYHERFYALDSAEKQRFGTLERETYAKGYAQNPKDAELVNAYGRAMAYAGDSAMAIDLLQQAAKLRPFNESYWWMLGVQQRKEELYEDALKSFEYAAKVRNSRSIRKNIQWIKKQLSQPVDAVLQDDLEEESSGELQLQDLRSLMETF